MACCGSCSAEEAARYLETYKVYENKPPDALLGQSEGDYVSKVITCADFILLLLDFGAFALQKISVKLNLLK